MFGSQFLKSVAGGVAVALVTLLLQAPPASANHHFSGYVGDSCLTQETAWGTMMRARLRYRMGTWAHEKNNLTGLRLRARFIPTTPGLNFHRAWGEYVFNGVSEDGYNNWIITVLTPPERVDMDWNLQVKMSWFRKWKRDWHVEKLFGWRESFCESTSPFSVNNPASHSRMAGQIPTYLPTEFGF